MVWNIYQSNPKESEIIDNKIVEFNRIHEPFTQKNDFISLNFHVKDDNTQEIIAGINALMYCWGVLYIDVLFVDELYRGQKIGSFLLGTVEEKAKELGATLSHLDTFDWQAKQFYLSHGYEIFGILNDCPNTHKRFYMKKTLKKT